MAAFLIESYKLLNPDAGDQAVALLAQIASSINATSTAGVTSQPPPFHAPRAAVVVNALWFSGLCISLMCALLITLIQEWSRRFMRAQVRPAAEGLRRYSRRQMLVHMGVQRYGLDRIASLVIALMHTAVILFLIGLDLFVFSINRTLAIVVASVTGSGALFYVIISSISLLDQFCPYHTPLTEATIAIVVIPTSTIVCLLVYCALLICAVVVWLTTGTVDPFLSGLLRPRMLWGWVSRPFQTSRILRSTLGYIIRPLGKSTTFMGYLSRFTYDVQDYEKFFLKAAREWEFLWGHVGDYILTRPWCIYWVGSCLLDLNSNSFYGVFVDLRNNPYAIAQIAAALGDVRSTFAAVGSVKVLQALLQAETMYDNISQSASDEDARWEMLGPIINAMDGFVERLDEANKAALARGDARIVDALSKFRWTLLQLWDRIPVHPRATSYARDQLQHMLSALDRLDNSIRLLPVSSSDGAADGLTASNEDRRVELASRNAFTLLAAVHRTGWKGYWESSDVHLIDAQPKPSIWHWREVYPHAVQRRRRRPASHAFRDFLLEVDERLSDWMRPGSELADPANIALHPIALRVLHDLASTVDLTIPPEATDGIHERVPLPGLVPQDTPFRPSSPTLSSAEEGSLNSAMALADLPPSPHASSTFAPHGSRQV